MIGMRSSLKEVVMTRDELIELAEYYRERHNEICQQDFIIEKPDYNNK